MLLDFDLFAKAVAPDTAGAMFSESNWSFALPTVTFTTSMATKVNDIVTLC